MVLLERLVVGTGERGTELLCGAIAVLSECQGGECKTTARGEAR